MKQAQAIPIRQLVIIVFIFFLLITVSLIGYIVFSNWMSSSESHTEQMAANMNKEVSAQVDQFISLPLHINEVNQRLISNGIVNLYNELEREKYMVGVLQAHDGEILYSFSYGSETGEYYGARRNEHNEIEIMRNNSATNGHSWYYSLKPDLTAGERVVVTGKFDPRERDWYQAAKKEQKPVFSPIYKHFVMDDLAVSAAYPIYNWDGVLQGVLGAHITLSRIDHYLQEIVQEKEALALIVEQKTGELVSNSLGLKNFSYSADGSIERLRIDDINNNTVRQAYEHYRISGDNTFKLELEKQAYYIKLSQYHKEGVEWLLITAIPESLFTAGIYRNIRISAGLTIIALLLSIAIYFLLTRRLMHPINDLIASTERFSEGDLTHRAKIFRNDEIGIVSEAFNRMAQTIDELVNDLEERVKERTLELAASNQALQENKDQLQLILDSTAEGIYGIDIEGKCTFCNTSCLKMLAYTCPDQLIGKNMHHQIHHSDRDGNLISIEDCQIMKAFLTGSGIHVDDDLFWRADGSSLEVEYRSYPQSKEGEIVGAVITFMDNTERKRNQEHIRYLSYHDSLTGLYNRMFFEQEQKRMDLSKNLPISIIMGDINGLKLTNDVFGHSAGDRLLKKTAEILKRSCREGDVLARVGGDEFAILLPNTGASEAQKIIQRIKGELGKEQMAAIKCSMALGYDTKISREQDIERTMANAEDKMYEDKTLNREQINSELIDSIIRTLHQRSPREKRHSAAVSKICEDIARAMGLSETQIRNLSEAGFLHDIGKIVLAPDLLNKNTPLSYEERKEMEQHPVVGYRILNLFDNTMNFAEAVLRHHEKWDGSGYPKGLKGEEIPRMARIIALAECFDAMTHDTFTPALSKEEARLEIIKQSGIKFDPEVVQVFLRIVDQY
jgi:diguanylate cyclase (GGDEF)-like protein/PAS domain S-box-containing protein